MKTLVFLRNDKTIIKIYLVCQNKTEIKWNFPSLNRNKERCSQNLNEEHLKLIC